MPRFTGPKICPGLDHRVNTPKQVKKVKKLPREKKAPKAVTAKQFKFDFTRIPYATVKRQRVALNGKFFKTTVEIPEAKRPKLDESVEIREFEDLNDVEEEPFEDVRKDVSNILTDWLDDDAESVKPQMTRQKAVEQEKEMSNTSLSYLVTTPKPVARNINSLSNTPVAAAPSTPKPSVGTPITSSIKTPRTPIYIPTRTDSPNAANTPTSKLYSIFTTPPAKNILSDVTNRMKKPNASLDKAAAPSDQYQIDAGQKVIGPKECPICHMVYDIGDPVDEKRHAAYHAKRNDLKYKISKNDKIVGYVGTDVIVRLKYSDEKRRKKVQEILKITEEEIGCGYNFRSSSVAFVYIRNERILGCLIAEPRDKACRVVDSNDVVLLSEETHPVKCGVNRIWVKEEFRKQNIATEMMNCLRKNFIYGEFLKIEDIAFSATTPIGHKFARKYTGRDDYLTYLDPSTNCHKLE